MNRTRLLLLVALALVATSLALYSAPETQTNATDPQGFFRFPDIHGDKIVFTSEGDLWVVSTEGGSAERLTTAVGEERFAKFSPDGKWIAFTGEYDGNADVYVMSSTGGEPVRLSFHPNNDQVVGWSPDGRIIYRSQFESGSYYYKLFSVSPEGGYPEELPLDKAATLTYEPNGPRVAFTRTMLAFHTWMNYHGGWAERIWVGNLATHDFKEVSHYSGNSQFPMWIGGRIFFLSDSLGRANIWSMTPEGTDLKRITTHGNYDARFPSAWNDKIVYEHAMDIWVLDTKTSQSHKVDITLPSDRLQRRAKFVDASKNIDSYDLSPDGKRIVVAARGELFSVPTVKDGLTRRLAIQPASRERDPEFSPNGKTLLGISDATGDEEFWIYGATGAAKPKQLSNSKLGWHYAPVYSPDGKWIAFSDFKCRLNIFNVETKARTTVDSAAWEIRRYTWSPDSKFLAYAAPILNGYNVVRVYDMSSKKSHDVTSDMYNSTSPSWDPDGKYLYFLQDATFNPYLGHVQARFLFNDLTKPYLLVLKATDESPFAPKADPGEDKADEKKPDKKDKDSQKSEARDTVQVEIDFDGITQRKVGIDVPSGDYVSLRAIPGKFYYLSYVDKGMLPEGPPDRGAHNDLHLYDLKEKQDTVVIRGINSYDISDDNSTIVVKKLDQFIRMEAGAQSAPPPDDEDAIVSLDQVTLEVNPRDEWKQMYNEAWRLERDFYYDPNMHGLDWNKIHEKYGSLIDRISTRDELNDLIGETISELSTGHTYVWGGDKRTPKPVAVGLLGIDVATDSANGVYKIARILSPHPGMDGLSSPLADPGLNVKVGDYLLAIDNQPLDIKVNYLKYLVKKAGNLVQLTVNDKPTMTSARQIIIRTMDSEDQLRYEDWVAKRRAYVDSAGGGKIGYVHLSNMMGEGLSEYGRQYTPQYRKDGLIIDVRYNAGGFVAEMILSELARKVWAVGRWGGYGMVSVVPTDAYYGHMAVVCNGETGSDGETFTEGTKALQLGPVIGSRTWGGWVGIRGDKPLSDRGTVTMPEFPGWSIDGRWIIEGWGTEPDIKVVQDPASVLEGKDPQLDTAISYVLKKIAEEPRKLPPHPPYPDKSQK